MASLTNVNISGVNYEILEDVPRTFTNCFNCNCNTVGASAQAVYNLYNTHANNDQYGTTILTDSTSCSASNVGASAKAVYTLSNTHGSSSTYGLVKTENSYCCNSTEFVATSKAVYDLWKLMENCFESL